MSVTVEQKNPEWLKKLRDRYKGREVLAVGFPRGETGGLSYPDGTPVIDVAVYNNFGTKSIPRRDFMTPGGLRAVKETKPIAQAELLKINEGSQTVAGALKKMGPIAEAQLKLEIRDLKEPVNSAETIARKGSSNPLVDTGLLVQSVTHEVR